jgi:hypothetical protein
MDEAERLLTEYEQAPDTARVQSGIGAAEQRQLADIKRAAVLAAMRKAGGVPEGWQLVPKLPTPEMSAWKNTGMHYPLAERIWDVMLAAAPQPPALDRDGIIEACASAIAELRNGKDADSIACYFLNNAIDAIRAMKVQK